MKKDEHKIIVSPVVSEKTTVLTEKESKYVFRVNRKANKIEIRKAIEKIFNVNVTAVNTMNYIGKKKSC